MEKAILIIFVKRKNIFLFDIEIEKIPDKIKYLDMNWFDLKDKPYKDAWKECPQEIISTLKSIPEIIKNKDKFYRITGIKIDEGLKKRIKKDG